jgi:hypothetical protein
MYVVAQRVRAPGGAEGVNAFYYTHGPFTWEGLPPEGIPDAEPGELQGSVIKVPPPGNQVRSYLDIVAPDDTPWMEIYRAFNTFVTLSQRQTLPWVGVQGRCLFRIGLERALANHWQGEVAQLYRAVREVAGTSTLKKKPKRQQRRPAPSLPACRVRAGRQPPSPGHLAPPRWRPARVSRARRARRAHQRAPEPLTAGGGRGGVSRPSG